MDAKVGIIGAGPAGVSAAVQLRRYDVEPMVFEKRKIGGLVENAYLMENTLHHPKGIKGSEFVKILENYIERYQIPVRFEEVKGVKLSGNTFQILTSKGAYSFEFLIVATGTTPKKLPYPGLKYHISEMTNKNYDKILIIGGGDIALDYSLSMSEMAKMVYVLHRSDIKAVNALQREVMRRENIRLIRGSVVDIQQLPEERKVITTAGTFLVDEVLVAIGRVPNVQIVKGITHPKMFIIGDAKNGIFRQTSIAIADGIMAAMKIVRWMRYGNPE